MENTNGAQINYPFKVNLQFRRCICRDKLGLSGASAKSWWLASEFEGHYPVEDLALTLLVWDAVPEMNE